MSINLSASELSGASFLRRFTNDALKTVFYQYLQGGIRQIKAYKGGLFLGLIR